MRRTALSMTWTPEVETEEAQVMIRTVEDIYGALRQRIGLIEQFNPLPLVRIFGAWMLSNTPKGAAYWGIEWYVKHSLDAGADTVRLLGSRYLSIVSIEPWQHSEPHFDLTLTNLPLIDDLGPEAAEEALGVSIPGAISLVSSHLLQRIDNPGLRKMALRHVIAHYFGKMANIPNAARQGDIEEHGGEAYCRGICAMRHTPSEEQALAHSMQESNEGVLFCSACQRDLLALLTSFHFGIN
jgi:hypothetical protein